MRSRSRLRPTPVPRDLTEASRFLEGRTQKNPQNQQTTLGITATTERRQSPEAGERRRVNHYRYCGLISNKFQLRIRL